MQEHPNLTLLREMVEDPVRTEVDFATDDVEWHFIGPIPARHGKADLEAYFADSRGSRDWESGELKVHDYLANDTHGVVLIENTVRRGAESFTYRTAEIYHFRDGKISARWAFSDDTEAINRFFRS